MGVKPAYLGGNQGEEGEIFGHAYSVGSFSDRLVESYAGPHDWLGSFRYGFRGDLIPYTSVGRALYDTWSAIAVGLATPFAIATAIPSNIFVPPILNAGAGSNGN